MISSADPAEWDDLAGTVSAWLPEFLAHPLEAPTWLIQDMLPAGGVVLLHGPTSIGKSPISWAMARAVCNGGTLWGHVVREVGSVVYVELDTPARLLYARLQALEAPPRRLRLECFGRPINVLGLAPGDAERLRRAQALAQPLLVVINTLRKAHILDDKGSEVPTRIYGAWRAYFPSATLLFVHHNRKEPMTPETGGNPDQQFSGTQAWQNDAQVAFHVMRAGGRAPGDHEDTPDDAPPPKGLIRVIMTKSQVSDHEAFHPITLQLQHDGSNFREMGPAAYRQWFLALDQQQPRPERIRHLMERWGIGKSAAYAAVRGLE